MSINLRIRSALDALGLKISEASEISGVPYRTLQNYLDGSRQPKAENLGLICTRLGVNASWLLTGEGPMLRGELLSAPEGASENPREQAILALFRSLDEDAQRAVQDVAEEKKRLRELETRLKELAAELDDAKKMA